MILQVHAPDFSLAETLACGQAFRWRRHEGWWYGFIPARPEAYGAGGGSHAARVRQLGAQLEVATLDPQLTAERVVRYFALDLDLAGVLASIDVDAQIHAAIQRHRGLRILRQDPWECLASFICSSYNNIKRIEGMVERLCEAFGEPVIFNGLSGWTFPAPEAIARAPERRLRALGLGFRAPYLRATAKRIAAGRLPLETLRRTDYVVTKAALLHCDGVGEKVADCVALFGFEKYEAFPIDVWMARAMRYYAGSRRVTPAKMRLFAQRHFGRYAGYAQQYLFHYIRTSRKVDGNAQLPSTSHQIITKIQASIPKHLGIGA